jgi:hypothetical protein
MTVQLAKINSLQGLNQPHTRILLSLSVDEVLGLGEGSDGVEGDLEFHVVKDVRQVIQPETDFSLMEHKLLEASKTSSFVKIVYSLDCFNV